MAFYGERFRRPDEEDIWEELKKMIINPPSEQEIAQKKLGEQAWIDSILSKAFPENPKPQSEPYLRYEDLLLPEDAEKYRQKQMALAQQKETTKRNPYDEINSRSDWSEELKAQKRAEVAKIQETARQREREINIENAKEHAKNFGGAALEIGSMAIPGMLQKKVATQAIKMGKPLAEQVIKKSIQRGAVEGTLSGAIEGLGRGIREDENILKSTAKGATAGGIAGTALGKIAGEAVANTSKIKNLDELLDKRKDWGIAFTKQSGKPVEAIEKLLEQKKGFVPKATKKEGIGDIDFVWGDKGKGLQHIIERRNLQGYNGENFVKELPELIKKGDTYLKKGHPGRKYIGGTNKEAAVRTDYNKKPQNWLTSAYYLEDVPQQASAGFRTLDQTRADKQFFPLSDLQRNENIISHSQSNLNSNNINTQTNLGQILNPNNSIKPPKSDWEWLEWLKRKRKAVGWAK